MLENPLKLLLVNMAYTFKYLAYPDKLNDCIKEQLSVGKILWVHGGRDCPEEQLVDI